MLVKYILITVLVIFLWWKAKTLKRSIRVSTIKYLKNISFAF